MFEKISILFQTKSLDTHLRYFVRKKFSLKKNFVCFWLEFLKRMNFYINSVTIKNGIQE